MKKLLLFTLILSCLCLCSCDWLSTNSKDPLLECSPQSSPDNPIPLGEYVYISNEKVTYKMKFVEFQKYSTQTIAIMNIEVTELQTGKTYSPKDFYMLLTNGLLVSSSSGKVDTEINIPHLSNVTFGSKGNTDFYMRFNCNIDDCNMVIYEPSGDELIYFASK